MNQPNQNDPEAIRSDIDVTRRRMDDTMEALGDRLQPRHLLDEVVGYFRRHEGEASGKFAQVREKVTSSADTAMHAVVDTVKQNPLPALVIGAGVAWMIYESRRDKTSSSMGVYDYDPDQDTGEGMRYDPDAHIDRPLEYPSAASGMSGMSGTSSSGTYSASGISGASWSDQELSQSGGLKDKLGDKASAAREKLSQVGGAAREKLSAMKERAGAVSSRVRERTGAMYTQTRDRVKTTADQHPLEVGLVCLAAGLIAGLAFRTPTAVNRRIGPVADRLRDRTRQAGSEMLEKGKRVASAAVSAVKEEAQAQGLTPEALREKGAAVAHRGTEAARDTARDEGLTPGSTSPNSTLPMGQSSTSGTNLAGSSSNDPTIARPAV